MGDEERALRLFTCLPDGRLERFHLESIVLLTQTFQFCDQGGPGEH